MIVNRIKQHRDSAGVRGLDQRFEIIGTPIGRVRRIWQHAIIAPIAPARKIRHRHQLDRGHAEPDQMVELTDGRAKRAFIGEGADMKLIEHDVVPFAARPLDGPVIARGIDDFARTVDVLGLEPRNGIGNQHSVGQRILVETAGLRCRGQELMPPAGRFLHREDRLAAVKEERHASGAWSPQAKTDAAIRLHDCAARRRICSRGQIPSFSRARRLVQIFADLTSLKSGETGAGAMRRPQLARRDNPRSALLVPLA